MYKQAPDGLLNTFRLSLLTTFLILFSAVSGIATLEEFRVRVQLLGQMNTGLAEIRTALERRVTVNGNSWQQPAAGGNAHGRDVIARSGIAPHAAGTAGRSNPARERHPDRLRPEYGFDYGEYLNRLENRRTEWTKAELQKFFSVNATRAGMQKLPGGVQYRVLRAGYGRQPESTDTVAIDYRVFLPDGTELYSSLDQHEPVVLRMQDAVPGLQQVLPWMQEGEQCELYMEPALAFPGLAKKLSRDPYEPLIYVVELDSVLEPDE